MPEETNRPSIFDFDSIAEYLNSVYNFRKSQRKSYSLRLWATKLGLKISDSGNLSRVLSGQRDLSANLAKKILTDLSLQPTEAAFFELLSLGKARVSAESLQKIKTCLLKCEPLLGHPRTDTNENFSDQ